MAQSDQDDIPADDVVIQDDTPARRLPVIIRGQYIKDLSLESPNAPDSIRPGQGRPSMDVDFSMDAHRADPEGDRSLFEVTVGTHIVAKRDDQTVFLIELQYATLVSLDNVPEERIHPLLLIEIPRLSFPYIRHIISNLTQQAGFAPVFLSPVDFKAFYMKHFGAQASDPGAGAAAAG